jgi:hypothetical protein
MEKIKDWLSSKLFWAKTGIRIKEANSGKPVDTVTIKCRGYYLFVDFDIESGEPTGEFGWSGDPTMNPTVPIREILIARKTK